MIMPIKPKHRYHKNQMGLNQFHKDLDYEWVMHGIRNKNISGVDIMEEKKSGNMPEKKYRVGGVTATVWKNSNKNKDGVEFELFSISLERSYKDKDDNWKKTNSFMSEDVSKAILVLKEAYRYINLKTE